eukprot:3087108-Rhodomonas_salina.1
MKESASSSLCQRAATCFIDTSRPSTQPFHSRRLHRNGTATVACFSCNRTANRSRSCESDSDCCADSERTMTAGGGGAAARGVERAAASGGERAEARGEERAEDGRVCWPGGTRGLVPRRGAANMASYFQVSQAVARRCFSRMERRLSSTP